MPKHIVHTDKAPQPVGAYSQGMVAQGQFVFVSGQVGLDPATSQLVSEEVADQARQAMENLKAVLEAAGASLSDVVKCTVMVKDINDFATVNQIYGSYFPEMPPARATFAVDLPVGALVEVECIALIEGTAS